MCCSFSTGSCHLFSVLWSKQYPSVSASSHYHHGTALDPACPFVIPRPFTRQMNPSYLDFMERCLDGKYDFYNQEGLLIEVLPETKHIYNFLPIKLEQTHCVDRATLPYILAYQNNQELYALLVHYYTYAISQVDTNWLYVGKDIWFHQDGFTISKLTDIWEIIFYDKMRWGFTTSRDAQLFAQNASGIMSASNWVMGANGILSHKRTGAEIKSNYYDTIYRQIMES